MNLRDSRVQRIYFCYGWNHNQSFFLVFFFFPLVCVAEVGGRGWSFGCSPKDALLMPPIGFIFFSKLMKICNIDSYYLLRQMVNIFPILVCLHVTAKKHNKKNPQENLFLKPEDKRGKCCFKNTLHI